MYWVNICLSIDICGSIPQYDGKEKWLSTICHAMKPKDWFCKLSRIFHSEICCFLVYCNHISPSSLIYVLIFSISSHLFSILHLLALWTYHSTGKFIPATMHVLVLFPSPIQCSFNLLTGTKTHITNGLFSSGMSTSKRVVLLYIQIPAMNNIHVFRWMTLISSMQFLSELHTWLSLHALNMSPYALIRCLTQAWKSKPFPLLRRYT